MFSENLTENSFSTFNLNYGCGERVLKNFLNCDQEVPLGFRNIQPTSTILENAGNIFFRHNAIEEIPIESNSVDSVFAEHFIEHLELKTAIFWLTEMHRILKPQSFIRISTPDLDKHVKAYENPINNFNEQLKDYLETWIPITPDRPAWRLNQLFKFWNHQWIFDFEEIRYVAQRAGFQIQSINRTEYSKGQSGLERFDCSDRAFESLYVEMQKT